MGIIDSHCLPNQMIMRLQNLFYLVLCVPLLFLACQDDVVLPESTMDDVVEVRNPFPSIIPLPIDWQPEGITVGKGHTAYVGSLYSGGIYEIDLKTGTGDTLFWPYAPGTVPAESPNPIVGLSFDERTGYIFAAGGFWGKGFVFDSKTGELVMEYQLVDPLPIPSVWVNDVVVTRDAVYFTDSFSPQLYKVPLGPGGSLGAQTDVETIPLTGDFVFIPNTPDPDDDFIFNSNGIDATPNGKVLILAHTALGALYKVDPATGHCTLVDLGGMSLTFLDGIYLKPGHNKSFTVYGVEGVLNRVTAVELESDLESGMIGTSYSVAPDFRFPTTVDMFGGDLYVVNARFDMASPFVLSTGEIDFEVVKIEP